MTIADIVEWALWKSERLAWYEGMAARADISEDSRQFYATGAAEIRRELEAVAPRSGRYSDELARQSGVAS